VIPRQPRIALISYGGTIASAVKPGVGATPSVSMSEIAAHIPELGAFEFVHQPSRLVASPHMTVDDLLDINDAVDAAIAQGCDGVVSRRVPTPSRKSLSVSTCFIAAPRRL